MKNRRTLDGGKSSRRTQCCLLIENGTKVARHDSIFYGGGVELCRCRRTKSLPDEIVSE